MENLPTCVFFISQFQGFLCFPVLLIVLGLTPSLLSTSLGGQNRSHSTLRRKTACNEEGRLSCGKQGRDGGNPAPAAAPFPLPWRKQRGACAASDVSACPLSWCWSTGMEASCTGCDSHSHTHMQLFASRSPATAATSGEREERFRFSLCKMGRKLSTLWHAVLHWSCAGPFCTNYPWTCSTLLKIVQTIALSSLDCSPTSSVLFDSPFLWKHSSFLS